jgi:hypothetical protein
MTLAPNLREPTQPFPDEPNPLERGASLATPTHASSAASAQSDIRENDRWRFCMVDRQRWPTATSPAPQATKARRPGAAISKETTNG